MFTALVLGFCNFGIHTLYCGSFDVWLWG